jgi:hypothetical protein
MIIVYDMKPESEVLLPDTAVNGGMRGIILSTSKSQSLASQLLAVISLASGFWAIEACRGCQSDALQTVSL